ncbi:MAG: hypothetical protein J0I22_15575 [Stenotrophomonas nitritireducens]|nr:hypothetical protein [Stenotrophomonas nitritireducens]
MSQQRLLAVLEQQPADSAPKCSNRCPAGTTPKKTWPMPCRRTGAGPNLRPPERAGSRRLERFLSKTTDADLQPDFQPAQLHHPNDIAALLPLQTQRQGELTNEHVELVPAGTVHCLQLRLGISPDDGRKAPASTAPSRITHLALKKPPAKPMP